MSNGRNDQRVMMGVEVTLKSASNFYSGRSHNLSVGGVFIAMERPPPIGTEVELSLRMQGQEHTFVFAGVVRWHKGDKTGSPGCGIQFVRVPAGGREAIAQFVQSRTTMVFGNPVR